MENTTSSLNKWTKKKVFFVIGSFVFLIIVILLVSGGGKPSSPSQPQEQSGKVSVGNEGFLRLEGQNEILVATSKENFKKLIKASVAKDTIGMAQMVQSGEVFFVDSGTKVLVIGSAFGSKEIRILEGKSATRSGWVPLEFVFAK